MSEDLKEFLQTKIQLVASELERKFGLENSQLQNSLDSVIRLVEKLEDKDFATQSDVYKAISKVEDDLAINIRNTINIDVNKELEKFFIKIQTDPVLELKIQKMIDAHEDESNDIGGDVFNKAVINTVQGAKLGELKLFTIGQMVVIFSLFSGLVFGVGGAYFLLTDTINDVKTHHAAIEALKKFSGVDWAKYEAAQKQEHGIFMKHIDLDKRTLSTQEDNSDVIESLNRKILRICKNNPKICR